MNVKLIHFEYLNSLPYKGCHRNSYHILNCHLYWESELRQVAMVQLVTIMAWTGAHHAFAVETFLRQVNLYIQFAIQRAFCANFLLCLNDVPDRSFNS